MGVWGLASLCGLTVREILGPSHPGGAPNIRLAAGVSRRFQLGVQGQAVTAYWGMRGAPLTTAPKTTSAEMTQSAGRRRV